jgi:TPP-dependent trihydroxycyclohexane-1,2-dione (THcHDO) dehydratase
MKGKNNNYDTLVEAIEALKKQGYRHNFRINDKGMLVEKTENGYIAEEVELHEFHRFEGNTNPADMSIVYAVQTSSGEKGIVVDSYGVYGSEMTSKFMNKVSQKQFEKNN